MMQVHEVATMLERAAGSPRGFSFVRLGDGEGALLRFGPDATAEDVAYLRTHFGPQADAADFSVIARNLRSALATADLIGPRDDVWNASPEAKALRGDEPDFAVRYHSGLTLREGERTLGTGISAHALRRLFGQQMWLRDEWKGRGAICSQWVCYDLALDGFWERLLSRRRHVGLVHCSPTLPQRLRDLFGCEIEFHRVPDKADRLQRWGPEPRGGQHFPKRFAEVSRALDRPLEGKLFLIGAGLVGKGYLPIIRRNGGVALDLGALLDAWDGRSTRELVYWTKSPQDPTHRAFALRASTPDRSGRGPLADEQASDF